MQNTGPVQSIDRALAILRLFTVQDGELDLAEISHRVALPKSTCHRLIQALAHNGFIGEGATRGRYRLGLAAAQVGEVAMRHLRPSAAVRARLKELSTSTGETVGLTILHRNRVLVIERVESEMPLRMQYGIGTVLPVYCTASGKVLLAFDDRGGEALEDGPFDPRTPTTIVDVDKLRAELKRVREQGYALDREECYAGLVCLAVPVHDRFGNILAIAVSGPLGRMHPNRLGQILDLLVHASTDISRELNVSHISYVGSSSQRFVADSADGDR